MEKSIHKGCGTEEEFNNSLEKMGEENHPEGLLEGLKLLLRLFENIGKNPIEAKFRFIKTTNAKLKSTLFNLDHIQRTLELAGFTYNPLEESWELRDADLGGFFPMISQLKMFIDLLEANMESPQAYEKVLALQQAARELKRKQEEEKKKNEQLKKMCDYDKQERKTMEKAKDSVACKRNFGANTTTYKDLGIDLNKKGG